MIFHAAKSQPSVFPKKTPPAVSLVNTERKTVSKLCVCTLDPLALFSPGKIFWITEKPQTFLLLLIFFACSHFLNYSPANCRGIVGSYQHPAGAPGSSMSWDWTRGILGWSMLWRTVWLLTLRAVYHTDKFIFWLSLCAFDVIKKNNWQPMGPAILPLWWQPILRHQNCNSVLLEVVKNCCKTYSLSKWL